MTDTIGAEMAASVAGTPMIIQTDATRGDFNPNYQPIYRGTGTVDALVGYYPGLAQGTFTIVTDMYAASLGALLAAAGITSAGTLLNPPTVAVVLGFGGSGGITITNTKCTYFEASGQQGGIPTLRAEFTALGPPTEGGSGGSPAIEQPLVFTDMDAATLLSGSSTDVTAFTLFVRRTMAYKRTNNHSLYAAVAKQSRVDVGGSVTKYNVGSGDRAAYIAACGGCPTLGTIAIALTQQCVPDVDGDPGTALTAGLSVGNAFYSNWTPNGRDDEFLTETFTIATMRGTFATA